MMKVDLKDRRILYQLDLDSRQSLTQIGKKVGLKKDVVSYRIKRLQDAGIIKNFFTVIDAYKLGYIVFRFYLVFQYVTPEIRSKIIEYLVKDKHTWVVGSIIGRYDLAVVLWVKDINDFYRFWEKMLDMYGDYFAEKTFSIYVQAFAYRQSYLLLDEYKKSDRLDYEITGGGKTVEIDDLDYKLLNEIAVNARIPLIELAEKLGCSSQVVNYRLKNLMKSGVIQAFRVGIDISKLGLKHFKVDIHLKEHSQRKYIMSYIKSNPYLVFISTSAGVSDLELEFHLESSDKVDQIMEEISTKFPGIIRNYDYFMVSKIHKVRCIPEL
jgi:DNA-binding Lrp family transcriptional regulator